MEKPSTLGETVIKPADFHSNIGVNLEGTDEDDIYVIIYVIMTERIIEKIATYQSMGSGWRLYSIIQLELHTVEYKSLRGETWIRSYPYPKSWLIKRLLLTYKMKIINVFLWCVLRALNPHKKDPQRLDKKLKEKENSLNMEGIEYPVSLKDIKKFENQTPTISITVLIHD